MSNATSSQYWIWDGFPDGGLHDQLNLFQILIATTPIPLRKVVQSILRETYHLGHVLFFYVCAPLLANHSFVEIHQRSSTPIFCVTVPTWPPSWRLLYSAVIAFQSPQNLFVKYVNVLRFLFTECQITKNLNLVSHVPHKQMLVTVLKESWGQLFTCNTFRGAWKENKARIETISDASNEAFEADCRRRSNRNCYSSSNLQSRNGK